MKTIVIYHSADFDGLFSREIARKHFGENAEYIGWDYGNPVPAIPEGAKLYMIDISVDGLMDFPGLTWIDHHKSAMLKYPESIRGYRIDGVAACRLAWQWFFRDTPGDIAGENMPTKEDFFERRVVEPLAVRLAGEYDVFDHRDERAALFQHGLRSQHISEAMWSFLLTLPQREGIQQDVGTVTVETLLDAGVAIQYTKTKESESIIRDFGFTVEFEGLKFLACNAARYNSFLFAAGIKPEHDGLLGFNWDGHGKWRVSMYGVPGKPDIDFSVIAAKHGGGGHKQACGFKAEKLPFLP